MKQWLWIFIIVVTVLCLIGSVVLVSYVFRRHRKRNEKLGISDLKVNSRQKNTTQGKKWNRRISIYVLLCFIFIVIILYQSAQGIGNRQAFDCLFVLVGAFFFLLQVFPIRNRAIRRERATISTTATFMMREAMSSGSGFRQNYHSIFEFSVKEITHKVRYPGNLEKEKETQVELYYAPEDPNIIYIPEIEKTRGKFLPGILLFYGILFPLVALLAPLFR